MLRRILNNQSKTITFAAFILVASTLGSKILGLLRDRVLAGKFGAGDELDMYYAAFRIPDFVYSVLIMGAVSAAFIPIFAEYLEKDKREAWRMVNNALTVAVTSLIFLSIIFILSSSFIVPLIAPGFDGDKLSLTIWLTRFMFLSPILFGLSSIFGAVLQVFRRFLIYSLAPLFYNLGIIIGAFWGTDIAENFGVERMFGLVAGVILGAFLHFIVQVPSVVSSGFRYQFVWDIAHQGFRKMVKLFIPRTVGLAVYQINFIVITAIASTLREGSIAVFNLANNLQYLPIGIFGISFATAAFPLLSEKVARNEIDKFEKHFLSTFRNILFFVVPASMLLFLLRAQIVRVVLGTGEFSWEDTRLTAAALGVFSLSIIAQSLIPLVARAFYAFHDTRTPVAIGIVSVFLNVALSFFFVRALSSANMFQNFFKALLDLKDLSEIAILGLVLAFSVSSLFNLLLLFLFFSLRIDISSSREIIRPVLKNLFAAGISGVIVFIILRIFSMAMDLNTFSGIFFQMLAALFVGIITYIFILILLGSREPNNIIRAFRKELSGKFSGKD